MDQRERPEHLQLVAESAAELDQVVEFIAGADLELVAVIAIAQPRSELAQVRQRTAADEESAA